MRKPLPPTFVSFTLLITLLIGGCATASTPASNTPAETVIDNQPHTLAEAEELAGFDVKEPSYLPTGVSFDFATFQNVSALSVTSHFKIVHEQYGDMGAFFQITQEAQTEVPPDSNSCGDTTDGCEIIQIGDLPVVYHLYASQNEGAATEGLNWYEDGFAFRLLRTAGEPNKLYKDELIKVVESFK